VNVLKPLAFGLDQAAADAVRRWKFRPGTLNGQPVDVIFNLTVNFKLN
jgi:TonB family protein